MWCAATSSNYRLVLRFAHSKIPEWEFPSAIATRTGCRILCDVNNVYVSACNLGWNASVYLAASPANAVPLLFAVATVFWNSGTTKLTSWNTTPQLFADEHKVPQLPPESAAYVAASIELTTLFL